MGGGGSKKKEEDAPDLYDEKRRTNVAKELVDTEKSYVKNLHVLCDVFLQPLKDSAASSNPILTTNEVKDIFGIIEVIVNFHATLLSDLDERMKKWDSSTCMGDIFAKNNAFFKMISTYVNGYNTGLNAYYQCKNKSKAFVQFLDKAIASTSTMLDLQSYLIMPVQRLPRYVLLLTELVKYSNRKHPGFQSLSDSLEGVKKVADFVNEEKKNAESALKMLQIQENLVGKRARTILEPTRKFYGEGTFTWINSSRKEPRPLHFFQSTPDKYKLKIMEPLVSVDLQEDPEQSGPKKSKFDIKTSRKVFTVHCDPDVDLDEWMEVFYWIRSGCGPRYEKVSAEAQKRNFTRADTLEHINPKKLGNKSDQLSDKQPKASVEEAKPKSPLPPTPKTTSPPPPSSPAPVPSPASPASPKTPPQPVQPAKPAPPSTNPPAKNSPAPPAKNAPTNQPDSKGKNAEPAKPQDSKGKSAEPAKPQDSKGKNTEPAKPQDTKGKSAEPAKPQDSKGKSTEPVKQQDSKGKSGELAKPDDSKPPRPAGSPPPIKEGGTKKAEALGSSASQPLERRPSFTQSVSAFFGMKSDEPPLPGPSPASPRNAAGPANSPASPRNAAGTAKPPAKK